MQPLASHRLSRLSFGWLLALLALLPLAQTAATAHLLSHAGTEEHAQRSDQDAAHDEHCELCLGALAVVGGSLPSSDRTAGSVLLPPLEPSTPEPASWLTRPERAYQSRAPPTRLN